MASQWLMVFHHSNSLSSKWCLNGQGSHSTGKMVKGNSRQGKHRENTGNLKILRQKIEFYWNKESMRRKNCCAVSMVVFFMLKMLLFHYKNTWGKLKFHREIPGKTGNLLSKMSGNHEWILVVHHSHFSSSKWYLNGSWLSIIHISQVVNGISMDLGCPSFTFLKR